MYTFLFVGELFLRMANLVAFIATNKLQNYALKLF